jgi:hypothetical protein
MRRCDMRFNPVSGLISLVVGWFLMAFLAG